MYRRRLRGIRGVFDAHDLEHMALEDSAEPRVPGLEVARTTPKRNDKQNFRYPSKK